MQASPEAPAPLTTDDPCEPLARYSPRVAFAVIISVVFLSAAYSFVIEQPVDFAEREQLEAVAARLSPQALIRNGALSVLNGTLSAPTGVAGEVSAAARPPKRPFLETSVLQSATLSASILQSTTLSTSILRSTTLSTSISPNVSSVEREAQQLSLFCFAWTPRRRGDEALMPYARILFGACDGHIFFTDEDAPGSPEGFVQVHVPATRRKRSDPAWLYHMNMVGIASAWAYILDKGMAERYDWLLNAELDHFFVASRAKKCIVEHLNVLRAGTGPERVSVNEAMMLSWGNVFVFNRKIALQMKLQWGELGAAITNETSPGMGCPVLSAGRANCCGACEQDMAYPRLPNVLRPRAAKYGPDGCSQFARSGKGVEFPFACWQDFPLGGSSAGQRAAIREIALMRGLPDYKAARQHCISSEISEKHCLSLFRARDVPVMHNFKTPELHQYGQKMLLSP